MKKDDSIRKRLHEWVDKADGKTLRTLDEIIGTAAVDWKDDVEFVNELKRRWNEYVNGGKTLSHEEVMENARKAIKNVKRRSA